LFWNIKKIFEKFLSENPSLVFALFRILSPLDSSSIFDVRPVINFIKILRAAFAPIIVSNKKVARKMLMKKLTPPQQKKFAMKSAMKNAKAIPRCQFHQHFTHVFFIQKCFSLVMFWRKKHFRTKNARIKC